MPKPSRPAVFRSLAPPASWGALENAVFGREFRSRMRGDRTYRITGAYALVVLLPFLLLYGHLESQIVAAGEAAQIAQISRALWTFGCGLQAVLVGLMVPAFTSGAITLEREREMLELLLLTRQSAFEICLGKLASGVGLGVILVLTSVPILSLSLVLGGLSPGEIGASLAVLLASVLAYGTLGLAASSFAQKTVIAATLAYMGVAFILGGGPAASVALDLATQVQRSEFGSDLGILAWIAACHALAIPPAVVLTGLLYAWRRQRRSGAPTRAWWLLVGGLSWDLFGMLYYLTRLSERIRDENLALRFHPVYALMDLMSREDRFIVGFTTYSGASGYGAYPAYPYAGSRGASNMWIDCTAAYLGAALVLFCLAVWRVRKMRA